MYTSNLNHDSSNTWVLDLLSERKPLSIDPKMGEPEEEEEVKTEEEKHLCKRDSSERSPSPERKPVPTHGRGKELACNFEKKKREIKPPPPSKKERSKEQEKKKKSQKLASIKEIVSLSKPQVIAPKEGHYKMFKIELCYIDEEGKTHHKGIPFGDNRQKYYVDHKNPWTRACSLARLKKPPTILDGRYYEVKLLNGETTSMKDNYLSLSKKLLKLG